MPYDNLENEVALLAVDNSIFSLEPDISKLGFYTRFGKRCLDIALIAASAPLVLPVVFVALFLVFLEGGHQALYSQLRVGRDGRLFRCWKIRTMVPNAEEKLNEYTRADADLAYEWAVTQKLSSDPRVTKLGSFLRKSSIDELPQLWNVLAGEMSLVGPRPFMADQQSIYDECGVNALGYYRVKPGLTGLWQVKSRHKSDFATRVEFDSLYLRHLSIASDLRIILDTILIVMRYRGR